MKRVHLPPTTTVLPPGLSHQLPPSVPLPGLWSQLDPSRQRQMAQLLAELIRRIRRPGSNVVEEVNDEQP